MGPLLGAPPGPGPSQAERRQRAGEVRVCRQHLAHSLALALSLGSAMGPSLRTCFSVLPCLPRVCRASLSFGVARALLAGQRDEGRVGHCQRPPASCSFNAQ